MAPIVVEVDAVRITVAHVVQPIVRAMLAVARARQQAVHHFLIGIGRRVGKECVDFLRVGGQAGKTVGHAANQVACPLPARAPAPSAQPLENEAVDVLARPYRRASSPGGAGRFGAMNAQCGS